MREEAKALSSSYSMPDYSTPDMELSVPDDWKDPVEDNFNEQWEYKPDYSEYEYDIFEGDTGQTGADGEIPDFNLDGDDVSGNVEGYSELIPDGEYGLSDFQDDEK